MLTNWDLYNFINFVANKEQTGNTMSPEQFEQLLHICNLKYFSKKTGLPEEYKVGVPLSRESWELTQNITEDLRQFLMIMGDHETTPLIVAANGVAYYPSDYYIISGKPRYKQVSNDECGVSSKYRSIEVVFDSVLSDRLSNSITQPSIKNPIVVFYADYIKFYPESLQYVVFSYLRYPATPVFAYSYNDDDELIYDETNSVNLEWNDINKIKICGNILSEIGINLREAQLQEYAEMKKLMGT